MTCRLLQIITLFISLSLPAYADSIQAKDLITQAINNFRGVSSYSEASMTIHRPDWERVMTMKAWTEGLDKSLVRIITPIKDKDSGTLLVGDDMWSYAPKINRIIKIPSSMSNQSWMGSDFSNNDISRADDIIDKYNHTLLETKQVNGTTVYIIESVPHEDAPVVWGREVITIDEHYVLLQHDFFDQDNKLIKTLTSSDITIIDGKHVALRERMQKADQAEEWTEFYTSKIKFNIPLSSNTFTLSNLRNPR